jgi:hypothetical protein
MPPESKTTNIQNKSAKSPAPVTGQSRYLKDAQRFVQQVVVSEIRFGSRWLKKVFSVLASDTSKPLVQFEA